MSELREQSGLASMTGFARGQGELSKRLRAAIVIRSVNHRYLDVAIRHGMREELPELESVVREAVGERVRRGRVTVQVRLRLEGSLETSVRVEEQAVRSLAQQLEGLDLSEIGSEVRLGEVLTIPSLVRVEEGDLGLTPAELAALRELLDSVVDDFDAMRRREGESLRPQLEDELTAVEEFGTWVGERVADLQERLVQKLSERIKRVLGDGAEPDPDRLLAEAALAADRADISEELVRLGSHTAELRARLAQGGVVGKVLDFLCQELNRELNTIGSKARDAGIAARLVDAKAAVERLREQVQNLE